MREIVSSFTHYDGTTYMKFTDEERLFNNNFLIKLSKDDRKNIRDTFYSMDNELKDTGVFFTKSASKINANSYQGKEIVEDDIIRNLIPPKLSNKIVIAGGSITNNILGLPATDYDIYFISKETSKKRLAKISKKIGICWAIILNG